MSPLAFALFSITLAALLLSVVVLAMARRRAARWEREARRIARERDALAAQVAAERDARLALEREALAAARRDMSFLDALEGIDGLGAQAACEAALDALGAHLSVAQGAIFRVDGAHLARLATRGDDVPAEKLAGGKLAATALRERRPASIRELPEQATGEPLFVAPVLGPAPDAAPIALLFIHAMPFLLATAAVERLLGRLAARLSGPLAAPLREPDGTRQGSTAAA